MLLIIGSLIKKARQVSQLCCWRCTFKSYLNAARCSRQMKYHGTAGRSQFESQRSCLSALASMVPRILLSCPRLRSEHVHRRSKKSKIAIISSNWQQKQVLHAWSQPNVDCLINVGGQNLVNRIWANKLACSNNNHSFYPQISKYNWTSRTCVKLERWTTILRQFETLLVTSELF